MDNNNEIWKPVVGYEGLYEVSNMGRVRSLDRVDSNNHPLKGVILKPYKTYKGYLMVGLHNSNKRKHHLLHRLVAEAFIPNPEDKPEIDHINTCKSDNMVENLRWVTRAENMNNLITKSNLSRNACKPCTGRFGSKHHKSKAILQFDEYGNFIKEWECAYDVERTIGISNNHIGSVCKGHRKTCGGFIWKYKEEKAA